MRIGFQVDAAAGQAPSAVTQARFLLPLGIGISTSELGLETCQPTQLQSAGPAGCPVDSLMGRGSALNEVSFGPSIVTERTQILLFSGPLRDGQPELLMVAVGERPVLANIVFPALVLPAQPPYGGLIDATLPLVPSLPEGPDVALVKFQTTIGPAGITYYETIKGKRVAFKPRGILLPSRCPRGGLPFAVQLTFQDGSSADASTSVACPGDGKAKHRMRT